MSIKLEYGSKFKATMRINDEWNKDEVASIRSIHVYEWNGKYNKIITFFNGFNIYAHDTSEENCNKTLVGWLRIFTVPVENRKEEEEEIL